MLKALLLLALSVTCFSSNSNELRKVDRQAILDATRPVAAEMAGQPVRIKVDRLNIDRGWAVLVGDIVSATGKGIDWKLADNCDPDLDKMLWVVLRKSNESWHVKHLEICAPEPPYWYLKQYGGFVWPCGVYQGLDDGGAETLEKRCRSERFRKH